MTTLYLSAPRERAQSEGKRSFEDTVKTGIGDRYSIPLADARKCVPGCRVVLLSKDTGKRAEGKLKKLVATDEKNGQRVIKYDVHIDGLVEVPYAPLALNLRRQGVLVTD